MTNTTYSAFAFLEQLFSLINKRKVDIAYSKKKKKECATSLRFVSQIMTVTGYQCKMGTFTIFYLLFTQSLRKSHFTPSLLTLGTVK